MKAHLITTDELLRRLGWPNARRLQRWRQEGLIERPHMGAPIAGGRGRTAYWPEWVVALCERVAILQQQGHALKAAGDEARRQLALEGWFADPVGPTSDRPRILAVLPYFVPRIGGVEHHVFQLATRLARRGHPISILTQRLAGTCAQETLDDVCVHRFGNASKERGRRDAYHQILRRVHQDPAPHTTLYLCLSVGKEFRTNVMCEILAVARRRGIPRIVRIPSSGRVSELAAALPEALMELRHANCVIALNPGIRAELLRIGCDSSRIVALPNGVDVDRFRPADEQTRAEIRVAHSAGAQERVVVCPSRWAPKKKIPELIALWRQLEGTTGGASRLWVVGDDRHEVKRGKVSRAIQAQMAQAGVAARIDLFAGRPHHEVAPFFRGADAYVSLSTQEGQSNALLEAMACGLPIVGPDTPAVSQLVTDGVNGFLFAPDDLSAAQDALRACLTASPSRLAEIGARNRALIERRYTVDLMVERFTRLLADLMDERTPHRGD